MILCDHLFGELSPMCLVPQVRLANFLCTNKRLLTERC